MKTALERAWGPALRVAGIEAERVYAWVQDHSLVMWVAFPNFGRVHHVTGQLATWEKALNRAKAHALTAFQGELATQGIRYRDVTDIFVDGLKKPRLSVMYLVFKAQGSWTLEQMDEIAARAANQYIDGFKPLPG